MIEVDMRPKYQMPVPGVGVFIAPKAVGRLFQLHDYTKCVNLEKRRNPCSYLLPVLLPNVLNCPRMRHVSERKPLC